MERITSSDQITRDYLDRWLFEVRHIDSVLASTETTLFGKTFSAPVATAALSHLSNFCNLDEGLDGMAIMAQGAKMADLLCFAGMGSEEELAKMTDTGASVVKIIKPYKDRDAVYQRIRHAEAHGAIAVGIDIDHAFNRQSGYDIVMGEEIAPITADEIAQMASSTKLPFVVKGVLSVQDAIVCLNAGVNAMVISHHNGRMNCSVPPLKMLPEIRNAVGNDMPLFVDCSLQNGQDVFRCLAFGANACCIGRPIMPPLKERGAEGVRDALTDIVMDLRYTMSMTGAKDLKHIDASVLHFKDW